MKRVEFREYDLTEKAFEVYSNSDFAFWKDRTGKYYVADNQKADPHELGTIDDVNDFLEAFSFQE